MSHPPVVASTWQSLFDRLEDWGLKPGADSGRSAPDTPGRPPPVAGARGLEP